MKNNGKIKLNFYSNEFNFNIYSNEFNLKFLLKWVSLDILHEIDIQFNICLHPNDVSQ